MELILMIFIGIGAFLSILSCLYLTFAMPIIIGYKIYRKIKYGKSLYD